MSPTLIVALIVGVVVGLVAAVVTYRDTGHPEPPVDDLDGR